MVLTTEHVYSNLQGGGQARVGVLDRAKVHQEGDNLDQFLLVTRPGLLELDDLPSREFLAKKSLHLHPGFRGCVA